jgi:hypothetical protein
MDLSVNLKANMFLLSRLKLDEILIGKNCWKDSNIGEAIKRSFQVFQNSQKLQNYCKSYQESSHKSPKSLATND